MTDTNLRAAILEKSNMKLSRCTRKESDYW